MAEKIYIVKASGGEYDDAWENNLCACRTVETAEAEVTRLKEQAERLKEMAPKVAAFYRKFLQENPATQVEVPAHPKGPSKQTKENRKAYEQAAEAWRVKAHPILEGNQAAVNEQTRKATAASRQFAMGMGADEDDLKQIGLDDDLGWPSYEDAEYTYEELEIK